MKDIELGKLMHVLGIENKYDSKLYHYAEDIGIEPIKCESSELDFSKFNKYEFGLLKRIHFDDFLLREMVEEEKLKRNDKTKKSVQKK